MAHDCPNYPEMTGRRLGAQQYLERQANALVANAAALGFVVRIAPLGSTDGIGHGDMSVLVDLARRLAVPK